MRKKDLITIKGNREGLHLFCEETVAWHKIIAEIKKRLTGEHAQFFHGSGVIVEIGTRLLSPEDVSILWTTFLECGIKINGIETGSKTDFLLQEKKVEQVTEQDLSATDYVSRKPLFIVNRNVRSGQDITFDGHVLVFGDVNPGAEIIATGFIIVMGTLRGIAHAGVGGDENAWVLAYRLQPTQLRIAHCITCAPAEEPQGPEIAKINEGGIVCELIKI